MRPWVWVQQIDHVTKQKSTSVIPGAGGMELGIGADGLGTTDLFLSLTKNKTVIHKIFLSIEARSYWENQDRECMLITGCGAHPVISVQSLAEAIPTQEKLVALAEWLEVSEQWLRFGTGRRRPSKVVDVAGTRPELGVVVVGKNQAALVPVVELLAKLSPKNVRLVESMVRCVLASQDEDE